MWYEARPKDFDLPHDGEPVAYFSDFNDAWSYATRLWKHLAIVEEIKKPNHLEFVVKGEEDIIKASFKYESHAMKYFVEKLNAKGYIEPNPQ